jgi:Flp pilus assembly protein TadD
MPENIPYSFRVDDAFNLSSFLARTGMREALAVHLERSLQFGRKTEWFLQRLGKVQLELKQWDSATESFEKLHQLDRTNTGALNELAFLAYRRGDISEALSIIKTALELEPDNRNFQTNYRRLKDAQ